MWNPFRKKASENSIGEYENNLVQNDQSQIINGESEYEIETTFENEFLPIEDSWTIKLKKIIRSLILAVIFLVPIFFLTLTAPGDFLSINKQLLIYILSFLSFILWLAIIIQQGGVNIKRSGFESGILILILTWLLTSIFSIQPYQSFMASTGFITLASLALFYFLFLNFFSQDDIRKILDFFSLGLFIGIFFNLLNILGLHVFDWLSAVSFNGLKISSQFNTIGSLNTLGSVAVLAFVLTTSQYFKISSNETDSSLIRKTGFPAFLSRILNLGIVVVSILVLLILNWWPFYLAISAGMFFITLAPGIIGKLTNSKLTVRTFNIMGPLIIFVIGLLFVFGGKFINFGFLTGGKLLPEASLSQRTSFEITKNVINIKPIFGYGPENFKIAFDLFKPDSYNQTDFWNVQFNNPSSELIKIVVVGGVVLLAGFICLFFYLIRGVFRKNSASYYSWEFFPVLVSSLVIFGFFPFNIVLYFIFWVLISLMALPLSKDEDSLKIKINDASLTSIISSLALVLVLAAGLVGSYLLIQKYRGDFYLARATRLDVSKSENVDQAIIFIIKALNANNDPRYLSGLSQLLLTRINLEINDKNKKDQDKAALLQNLTKSLIDTTNKLTSDFKNDSMSWFNAAIVYENLTDLVAGSDNAAASAYNEYLKRSPKDPNGYIRLGNMYLNRSERNRLALADAKGKNLNIKNEKEVAQLILDGYGKAEENFKQAINLKGDLATAIYNLGIVYERENKIKEAIKQLELSTAREFNNPGFAFELGLLYYRDNQKDKAFNEMLRAVTLFNNYSNARWYLALMLEERGRIDLAIQQLNEITKIAVNKDNPILFQKIANLEAGQREIPPAKVTSKQPLESKKPQ